MVGLKQIIASIKDEDRKIINQLLNSTYGIKGLTVIDIVVVEDDGLE